MPVDDFEIKKASHFAYKIRYYLIWIAPLMDMLMPQLNVYYIGSPNLVSPVILASKYYVVV